MRRKIDPVKTPIAQLIGRSFLFIPVASDVPVSFGRKVRCFDVHTWPGSSTTSLRLVRFALAAPKLLVRRAQGWSAVTPMM